MNCDKCNKELKDGEAIYNIVYGYFDKAEQDIDSEQQIGLYHAKCFDEKFTGV